MSAGVIDAELVAAHAVPVAGQWLPPRLCPGNRHDRVGDAVVVEIEAERASGAVIDAGRFHAAPIKVANKWQ